MPSFRYRNVEEDFVEIENTADVFIRLGNHTFSIANKLEYAIYGDENLLSGGFVYLEYARLGRKNKMAIEPFFQMHWQDIRGLERKYAGGSNIRWIVLVKPDLGIFAGAGALYESEKWNYSGVSDSSLIPAEAHPVEVSRFRGTSYLSLKKTFDDLFDLDLSVYFQPTFSAPFDDYRMAASSEITYNFSEHLGLTLQYQNIYDSKPEVPIDHLYNDVTLGFVLSF